MAFDGTAVIGGYAEHRAARPFAGTPSYALDQWAELAAAALSDAGIAWEQVDGLACAGEMAESPSFMPAALAEHCGWSVNFAERLDLGGASSVGMVWRAALAVEAGLCDAIVCAITARATPEPPEPQPLDERYFFGASSPAWGSPQAEFDIPFGNVGQNGGYAMYAQRYHETYGWDEVGRAKIAVDQRVSANANPDAVFHDVPLTIDDVLGSRMIADPLRLLEIVMPVFGGGAVVVCRPELARRHRPVAIKGFGEHITHKTPTYGPDMTTTPVAAAARRAFTMADRSPQEMHMAQIYDCYTITALLSIEDSGFCEKGKGMAFVQDHDLSYRGDFPVNTHGGQLGYGQPGAAGGMTQVVEAVRQIQGRAEARQLARHDLAYVTGTGGVMSEQSALILEGAG